MVSKEVTATHLQAGQGWDSLPPGDRPALWNSQKGRCPHFPLLSQVVSQLPVGPESGETLFLAEQPPLPLSLTNGTTVPTAKPAPTLIKVQFSS